MHTPVYLQEVVDGLNIKPAGLYIDATVGEGGHLLEIIKKKGKVLGIDWDENQLNDLKNSITNFKELILVNGNFADIKTIAEKNKFYPVDGILFDLGLSFKQLINLDRGFSYKKPDEILDMRLNLAIKTNASDILNNLPENDLYELIVRYSEDTHSKAIVKNIIKSRRYEKIIYVKDLLQIIDKTLGIKKESAYARIFQALRIIVNDEINNLKKGLDGSISILKKGGRLVVLSFHSLEDRVVKLFVKNRNLIQINKKVRKKNIVLPYEKSAKLRIITNIYENTI